MSEKIKEVTYDETQPEGQVVAGHPLLPQVPYPGYDVDYPTCSAPSQDNVGCDAFKKDCTCPGKGPFTVAFTNKSGRKEFTHCRHWMHKLQYKRGYTALGKDPEDAWESQVAQEEVEKEDGTKVVRTKRLKMKHENVKFPPASRQHPQAPSAPEVREVSHEDAPAEELQPEGPVEGIKHGNRRKGNQG